MKKKFRKLIDHNNTWKMVVLISACLVVFATTYALILPAITVEKDQAEEAAGYYLEDIAQDSVSSAQAIADNEEILGADGNDPEAAAETSGDFWDDFSAEDEPVFLSDGSAEVIEETDTVREGLAAVFHAACADRIPEGADYADACTGWMNALSEESRFAPALSGYVPDEGDLIFFGTADGEQVYADQVGIVAEVYLAAGEKAFELATIVRAEDGEEREAAYYNDDSRICGYGLREGKVFETEEVSEGEAGSAAEEDSEGETEASVEEPFEAESETAAEEISEDGAEPEEETILEGEEEPETEVTSEEELETGDEMSSEETGESEDEKISGGEEEEDIDAEEEEGIGADEEEADSGMSALTYRGEGFTVTMTCDADAQIPEGAVLDVREILPGTEEYALYSDQTDAALSENWDEATALPRFFDITILYNGEEIQPAAPVSVQIALEEAVSVSEDDEMRAIHFADDVSQVLEAASEQPEAEGPLPEAAEAVSFDAESFSVYGIVPTATITKKVITADGETFEINVTYGKVAEIPEGAALAAAEITAESDPETYNEYTALSAAALTGDPAAALGLARLFDIAIVDAEGEKVEPQSAVQVKIGFAAAEQDNGEEIKIVHFADEGTELLDTEKVDALKADPDQSADAEADAMEAKIEAVTFETSSFSVFEVVQPDIVPKDKPLEDGWYRIISNVNTNDKWGDTIDGTNNRLIAKRQGEEGTAWYLEGEQTEDRSHYEYKLSIEDNGEKKYLMLGKDDKEMQFVNEKDQATPVNIIKDNNGYRIETSNKITVGKDELYVVRMNSDNTQVIFTTAQSGNRGLFTFEPVEYIGDGYYTIQTACTGTKAGISITGQYLQSTFYGDNANGGTTQCLNLGDAAVEWHFEHVPGDDTGSQYYISYHKYEYVVVKTTEGTTGGTTGETTEEIITKKNITEKYYVQLNLSDESNGHLYFVEQTETGVPTDAAPITLHKQGNNYRMSYGGNWIRVGADCNRVMCSNDNNDAAREEWILTLVSADEKSQSRPDVQHPTETYTIVSYLPTGSNTEGTDTSKGTDTSEGTEAVDKRDWHPSMNAAEPQDGHISYTDVVVFTNTAGSGRLAVDSTVQPASEWQFEAHGAGFYIYTRVQGVKKYLRFSANTVDTETEDETQSETGQDETEQDNSEQNDSKYTSLELSELPTMLLKTPVAGLDGVYQITDEHGRYKLFLDADKGYYGTTVTTADVLPSTYFYLLEQVVGAPSGSLGGGEEGAIHNDTQYAIISKTGEGDGVVFYAMMQENNNTIDSQAASVDGYNTTADVTQWRFKKVQNELPYVGDMAENEDKTDGYYSENLPQYYVCFGKDADLRFLKLDSNGASITNQTGRQPLQVEMKEIDGVELYRIYSVDENGTEYSLYYNNGFNTTGGKTNDTYLRLCSVVADDAWPMAGQKFVIRTLKGKEEGEGKDETYFYLALPTEETKDGNPVRGVAYTDEATPTEWLFDKNIYSAGSYQIKIGDLWLLDNGNEGFTESSDDSIYKIAIENSADSHPTTKEGDHYHAALVCSGFNLRNTTWYFDEENHLISGGTYYDSNGDAEGWDWPAQSGTTGGRRLAMDQTGKVYILDNSVKTPEGWFDTFTTEKLPDKLIGDVDETSKYAIVFVPSRYWKEDANPSDQIHSLAMLNTKHQTQTNYLASMLTYVTKKDHQTGTQYVFSTTGTSLDYHVENISQPVKYSEDTICWQFEQVPGATATGIDGFAYYLKTKTEGFLKYLKADTDGTLEFVNGSEDATQFVLQIDNSTVPTIGYQPYFIKEAGSNRYLETDQAESVMGQTASNANSNETNKTATDAILDGIKTTTGFHLVEKTGDNKPDNNNRFLLARYIEELEDSHTKTKVSVCDLVDGQKTMIYRRWLDADNVEHFFAVLTDGSLREVYDGGDTVGWRENYASEDESLYLWTFNKTENGGYYTFQNSKGEYLLPQSGYSLVYGINDVAQTGVTLDGRNRGEYGSSIVGWDYNTTTNYYLALNGSGNGFYSQAVADGFKFTDADEFFFAQDVSKEQYSIPVQMIKDLKPTKPNGIDTDGKPVLIYVRDSAGNVYAVGGDGTLLPVEEYSGYIIWKEAGLSGTVNAADVKSNYLWTIEEHSDKEGDTACYDYTIKNTATGKYLLPQSGDIFIFDEANLPKNGSDEAYNALSLKTNDRKTQNSDIEGITTKLVANSYNSSEGKWYPYTLILDESGGKPVLKSVSSDSVQSNSSTTYVVEFGFAQYPAEPNDLHTVETVDNVAMNITIKMFDYMPDQKADNNGYWHYKNETNWPSVQSDTNHLESTDGGANGYPLTGLVKNELGEGYPKAKNGNSLADLFDGTWNENIIPMGDANYLFLKSVYESTGYLEYSSFDNYAYFNDSVTLADGSHPFIVYDEVGSPYWTNTGANQELSYYLSRGNFMPFNKLEDATRVYNYYLHDPDGSPLSLSDPNFGQPVYVIEKPNYLNGMTMEATFYQTKDGKSFRNPGEDVIFEFNGDDDMWVFVDGVLLLDMGGIHDAHTGWINFATGQIYYEGQEEHYANLPRTIKEAFKAASKLPNGDAWPSDDSEDSKAKIAKYFEGDTFADYTSHEFKMFYMERGAGASNLHLRFNLETVPKGAVSIRKELTQQNGVSLQKDYGNITYAYQLYIRKGSASQSGVENTYLGKNYNNEFEVVKPDVAGPLTLEGKCYATVSGKDDKGDEYTKRLEFDIDGTFHLKAGETAQFDGIPESYEYYVEEVGVNGDVFNVDFAPEGSTNSVTPAPNFHVSGIYKVNDKVGMVSVTNTLKKASTLSIKKEVEKGAIAKEYQIARPDTGFSFYVYLEDHNGDLVAFSNGGYYITKEETDGEGTRKYYYHYGTTGSGESLTAYGYVKNGVYISMDGQPEKREAALNNAGNNGAIEGIPAGYTIEIEGLMPGTKFVVAENLDPTKYGEYKLESFKVEENCAKTFDLSEDELKKLIPTELHPKLAMNEIVTGEVKADASNVTATAINKITKIADITLLKVDGTDGNKQLPGAQFNLSYWNGNKKQDGSLVYEVLTDSDGKAKIYETSDAGEITFKNLPVNQYYKLTETHAPDGYNLITKDTYFRIGKKKNDNKWSVIWTDDKGEDLEKKEGDENAVVPESGAYIEKTEGTENQSEKEENGIKTYSTAIVVPNTPGRALPSTGGPGTSLFYLLGTTLASLAGTGLVMKRRRRYHS